ncbi:MAG: PepSY-like domain-containing protein [Leadbetterella sp.]
MKNIRLFLLLAVVISVSITFSCTSIENVFEETDLNELNFIAMHDSVGLGKRGEMNKLTEIDPATLPAITKAYVSGTYPGSSIKSAAKTESGSYVLHITTADGKVLGLIFDTNGAFLSAKDHKDHSKNKVDIATLLPVIKDYITKNYAGATIEKAYKSDSGQFSVSIKKADGTKITLGFDAKGTFTNEVIPSEKDQGKKGKDKGTSKGKN